MLIVATPPPLIEQICVRNITFIELALYFSFRCFFEVLPSSLPHLVTELDEYSSEKFPSGSTQSNTSLTQELSWVQAMKKVSPSCPPQFFFVPGQIFF